jgi:large subunit ribosomal protein L10
MRTTPRPDKAAAVAELTDAFRSSNAGVLTEYRGLTVAQLKELRRSIGDHGSYVVVKNTLTAIAAKNAGVDAFDGQLAGPSAIAFITGDPVEAAKGLRTFARANPQLVIKGGYLDGRALSAEQVGSLADLDSREVLLSKMAGAMKASLTKAAYLFNAPLSKAVRTVEALRVEREASEGPVPAAEPTADEATATEAAPATEETTAETSAS